MSTFQDMMDQAVAPVATPVVQSQVTPMSVLPDLLDNKKAAVEQASAAKKAAMGPLPTEADYRNAAVGGQFGVGAATATPMEADMRNLSPAQIMAKYPGEQGMQMILSSAAAGSTLAQQRTSTKVGSQGAADAVSGLGLGIANAAGGVLNLAAMPFSNKASTTIAEGIGELNDFVQGNQSASLQDRRIVNKDRTDLFKRDSIAIQEADKKSGDSALVAGLKRVGREAVDAAGAVLESPQLLADTSASGLGSLLVAGPTSKLLGGVTSAATKGTPVAKLAAIGEKIRMPATIGAMEGGGAAQQTGAEIGKMSYEKLAEVSPMFNELVASGVSQEEAKTTVQAKSMQMAAAIAAPLAAATGTLVSKFEGSPFSAPTIRHAVGNLVREGVEETIQSGTGQLAQNLGTKQYADSTKDVLEGVGEQAGIGGVGGIMAAGITQAPRTAALATANTAVATYKALRAGAGFALGPILKAGEKVAAANEAASPVSAENLQASAMKAAEVAPQAVASMQAATEAMPATVAPEVKAQLNQYAEELTKSAQFDPEFFSAIPQVESVVAGSTSKVDAVVKLAKDAVAKNETSNVSALVLNAVLADMDNLIASDPKGLADVPKDHPAHAFMDEYRTALNDVVNTPQVKAARRAVQQAAEAMAAESVNRPVTAENVGTEEGIANARFQMQLAQIAPEKANLEQVQAVLDNAEALGVTSPQRAALDVARALLTAQRENSARLEAVGLKSEDYVTKGIFTDEKGTNQGGQSALEHANSVREAYTRGDLDLARSRLEDFLKFAQHMSNKVGAANASFDNWNANTKGAVHYEALSATPQREWKQSAKGLTVHPSNPGSLRFFQKVNAEAQTLASIANSLTDAFPELGLEHVAVTPLNPALIGDATKLATTFTDQSRLVKPEAKAAPVVEEKASQEKPAASDVTAEATTETPVKASPEPVVAAETTADKVEPKADVQPTETPTEVKAEPVIEAEVKEPAKEVITPPAPAKTEPVEAEVTPVVPAKTGIAKRFEGLVDTIKNQFTEAFGLKDKPTSRLVDMEQPVNEVRKAFNNDAAFNALAKTTRNQMTDEIGEAWSQLIAEAPGMLKIMNAALNTALGKTPKTGDFAGQSLLSRIEKGEDTVVKFANTKAVNIAENVDGKWQLNKELAEGAILAGLQWFVTNGQSAVKLEAEDVARITGLQQEDITQDLFDAMDVGISKEDAIWAITSKVNAYWGLNTNKNAPIGFTEGIPQAIATEVFDAMIKQGAFLVQEVNLADFVHIEPGVDIPKTINRYVLNPKSKIDPASAIRSFPDALDTLMLTEPEYPVYFGSDNVPVASTQMGARYVPNTPEQLAAIRANNKTAYRVNPVMLDFFKAMGMDNVLSMLVPAGGLDPELYNERHYKSLEGKTLTTGSAFQEMLNMEAQMLNRAALEGVDVNDLDVHYAHNMSRVGRLQMLGRYNPQSSKLMREVMLPTWSTTDLSNANSDASQMFRLAQAQALGIKVHVESTDVINKKLNTMYEGALAEPLTMLQSWLKNKRPFTSAEVDLLKESLGGAMSPVAIHALTEQARWMNASEAERAAFKTSLYVEADGVTNGPVNAMAMLSSGEFTPEWLASMAKGGLFLGKERMTMNDFRSAGGVDLYTQAKNLLADQLGTLRRGYPNGTDVGDHFKELFTLMSQFMGNDFIMTPGSDVPSLDRGVVKNPLTITLYGSGAKGIAGNIVDTILDKMYARMSEAVQGQAEGQGLAESLFPGPNAEADLAKFLKAFDALTNNVVKYSEKKGLYLTSSPVKSRKLEARTFEVTPNEYENLRDNMLSMFVSPMRDAISETVGVSLLENMDLLRQATQVHSLFMRSEFYRLVEEANAAKAKADPNWRPSEFLSQAEIDAIHTKLGETYGPMLEADGQNFYLSGSNRALMPQMGDITRAMAGGLNMAVAVPGPRNAGVGGVASLVIGMGDGKMIQGMSRTAARDRSLPVFDGINFPLDNVAAASEIANRSVTQSWQGNPLKVALDGIRKVMAADKGNNRAETDLAFSKDVARALMGLDAPSSLKAEELTNLLDQFEKQLSIQSDSIDARHAALAKANFWVDQMASAQSPYQNTGAVIEGDYTAQANALNKLVAEAPVAEPVTEAAPEVTQETKRSDDISEELSKVGRVTKSGAREVSYTALKNLVKAVKVAPAQRELVSEIIRSLAVKEYKVVQGTMAQMSQWAADTGKQFLSAEQQAALPQAFVDPTTKTIYLANPSSESLVHELIHASTLESVESYYKDTLTGDKAPITRFAINNIEKLMDQFQNLGEAEFAAPEQLRAYRTAMAAITQLQAVGDRAGALNEFMAWGLTNQALQSKLEKVKMNPLVEIAGKVLTAIKQMIWGRKVMPSSPGTDMFSNLSFNTSVVIRQQGQPSSTARVAQTTLFQNALYGTVDRLSDVKDTFRRLIVDNVRQELPLANAKDLALESTRRELFATPVADDFAASGFLRTAQERDTFNMVVSALATAAKIDTNALAKANELYAYVMKTIKTEDFMENEAAGHPADYAQAAEKYNTLVGKNVVLRDAQDRTTLMSSFLALSMVDEGFRNILAKMEVPKAHKNDWNGIDNSLTSVGNMAMEFVGDHFSGVRKAGNVQAQLDNLVARIDDMSQQQNSTIDQFFSKTGGLIDRGNEITVNLLDQASNAIIDKAIDIKANTKSKTVKALADFAQIVSSVATEDGANRVAEGIISGTNNTKMWAMMRDMITDLVGRTPSNAAIYDMIKKVRSAVSTMRQTYRESVPGILASKFKSEVSEAQWADMFHGMAKTDMASMVASGMAPARALSILADSKLLAKEILSAEAEVKKLDKANEVALVNKSRQLADYIVTGETGTNLLRNAYAVANLFNENTVNRKPAGKDLIRAVDHLVTLYSMDLQSLDRKNSLAALVRDEPEGMAFALSYLQGQHAEEQRKLSRSDAARANAYKGYIPSDRKTGVSLFVADSTQDARLKEMSFQKLAPYQGSNIDPTKHSQGYFYSTTGSPAQFMQGILQNVRDSVGGVDAHTGLSMGLNAGVISDKQLVRRITNNLGNEKAGTENLLPVFDKNGNVTAYERSVDPKMLAKLEGDENMARMIGQWRGRQAEEEAGQIFNNALVDNLKAMYDRDLAAGRGKEYVDLFGSKADPVIRDAYSLLADSTIEQVKLVFGDEFMVRRDMINDVLGYRMPTIGDAWTGNTRWNQATQDAAKKFAMGIGGNEAYGVLVNAEKTLQNFVKDARVMIVVKSVVVPFANAVSNFYQLASRGVPIRNILGAMPKKLAETNSYVKTRLRAIEAEAELRAADGDVRKTRVLEAELKAIDDAHKRMSIYPLIKNGEFSAISDAGISREDIMLTEGKLHAYMEKMVDKMPDSFRTAGRYALITKDTALFQGLQKSVEYSDFLAKAVLYDDLVTRGGMTEEQALGRVTEEFVNYERLAGRFRNYMESVGLLWFWNFKIRSTKIALSMVRNNPLHSLMVGLAPAPGGVGTPIGDNLFSKGLSGSLWSSLGMGQGFRAIGLNPWANILH